MPHEIKPVITYDRSTWEPKESPEELKAWWARDLPRHSIFRPYIVKVLDENKQNGRHSLTFEFIREEGAKLGPITVTLPTEEGVWPDLPSTAQLVKKGEKACYGFLFLADRWIKERQLDAGVLAEADPSGQKFPPAGMDRPLPDPDIERVTEAMVNPIVRKKMVEALDNILKSLSEG